jgi:predicted O-methyltransferase YrrM
MSGPAEFPRLASSSLPALFGRKDPPPPIPGQGLGDWQMERDDAPVFRYLYRAHQPRRHLEFGTWQGFGTCLCLDESAEAKVWTINLPDGETKADGDWAYVQQLPPGDTPPGPSQQKVFGTNDTGPLVYHRTDANSFIGRFYRKCGFAHRVTQIYADSRDWDSSTFAPGFFDSVLIDGGHDPEVVINDTRKALPVLRPGGMILWHDFCPLPEIRARFDSVKGVTAAIDTLRSELNSQLQTLVWIDPSWILLGIKK